MNMNMNIMMNYESICKLIILLCCFKEIATYRPSKLVSHQMPVHLGKKNQHSSLLMVSNLQDLEPKSKLLSYFENDKTIFACPATLSNVKRVNRFYGLSQKSYFINPESSVKYPVINLSKGNKKGYYYDFTIKEELNKPIWTKSFRELFNSNFFSTNVISSVYERGYRQNFENAGFPGIDAEFKEVYDLFIGNNSSVILDISCGSGFMTRKLLTSQQFPRVVAADLSPTMIRETNRRIVDENINLDKINFDLIRCDSARLPFKDKTFDGIHAGAAIHCWPRLDVSLREIYRVLKPGGVFYASTFLNGLNTFRNTTDTSTTNVPFNVFPSVEFLVDLFERCGFDSENGNVVGRKQGSGCAILIATKR